LASKAVGAQIGQFCSVRADAFSDVHHRGNIG
jgi:hypothetical protein